MSEFHRPEIIFAAEGTNPAILQLELVKALLLEINGPPQPIGKKCVAFSSYLRIASLKANM